MEREMKMKIQKDRGVIKISRFDILKKNPTEKKFKPISRRLRTTQHTIKKSI